MPLEYHEIIQQHNATVDFLKSGIKKTMDASKIPIKEKTSTIYDKPFLTTDKGPHLQIAYITDLTANGRKKAFKLKEKDIQKILIEVAKKFGATFGFTKKQFNEDPMQFNGLLDIKHRISREGLHFRITSFIHIPLIPAQKT